MSLLHLALPAPRMPRRLRNARASVLMTTALHMAAAAALATLAVGRPISDAPPQAQRPAEKRIQLPRMVFLQVPGPGGGGGGGGDRQPSPPSRAQSIGTDRIALPVARPVRAERDPEESNASQMVVLPSVPLASGFTYQTGLPEAPSSLAFSLGPGTGGGVGDGSGTGMGSGSGPGLGPGTGGGFGGGAYLPGNGVTAPTLLTQVRPNYTADAMQRKIQGTVVLEMIVGRDGIPRDVRVRRSLDAHGLDEEAIRAAKEWRFNPGRRGDMPVDVLVVLVIDFHIR